jgi:RimJ/RimL family protein N-acetyltransferase
MTELLTRRLRLRPLEHCDLAAFVNYRRQPSVARYQSWSSTYSMADARTLLAAQRGVELGEPGIWLQLAALDRTTGVLCGDCAVRVVTDQPATAEIGVTLSPHYQGKGLATEALIAVVGACFDQLGMHRVFAHADDRNRPVHRLLENLGLRCEARHVDADWFKDAWSTLRVYAILEHEWQARYPMEGRPDDAGSSA